MGLLGIGAAVLLGTSRYESVRRAGGEPAGVGRFFTWGNAARGGGLAALLWGTVAVVLVFRGPGHAAAAGATRLAVLPFENRGDSSVAYFADGMTDAVRGKLSALPGMEVTARSSSEQYRRSAKSPQDIAGELGVRYLLTATVRWQQGTGSASRVQVSPELIDATTGGVKWQQSFDAALTDVFQVQGQIAGQVAEALDLALGARERQGLEGKPTENLAAYDAYLRGEALGGGLSAGDPVTLRRAIKEYEKAVALDSNFALAWAQLSIAYGLVYANGVPGPAEASASRRAADKALAIMPGLPEAHQALGSYYNFIEHDYAQSLAEAERGLKLAPTNANLLRAAAAIKQSLGQWDASVADLTAARTYDPRSVPILRSLGGALASMRRYPEAQEAIDQALTLAPTNLTLIENRAMLDLARGNLADARRVIAAAERTVDRASLIAYLATYQDLYWLLDDSQQQELLKLPLRYFDDNRGIWAMDLAQVYQLRGDRTRTRAYADSARQAWDEQLRAAPDDPQLPALRAVSLAYMGQYDDAVKAGEAAAAKWPISRDAVNGAYFQLQLVRIYLLAGKSERALDELEKLLAVPFYLSPGWLRADPTFAGLKGNPRFERMASGA